MIRTLENGQMKCEKGVRKATLVAQQQTKRCKGYASSTLRIRTPDSESSMSCKGLPGLSISLLDTIIAIRIWEILLKTTLEARLVLTAGRAARP